MPKSKQYIGWHEGFDGYYRMSKNKRRWKAPIYVDECGLKVIDMSKKIYLPCLIRK